MNQKSIIFIKTLTDTEHNFDFSTEIMLQESFPHLQQFSFDNFSDKSLANYALELLKISEMSFIVVDARQVGQLGVCLHFFSKMGKNKKKLTGILIGENDVIEKLMRKNCQSIQLITKLEAIQAVIINLPS